jgi:hypothetical protein
MDLSSFSLGFAIKTAMIMIVSVRIFMWNVTGTSTSINNLGMGVVVRFMRRIVDLELDFAD